MNRRSWVLAYACAVEMGTWSWFKGSLELSTMANPTGVGQEASSPRSFIRQVRKVKSKEVYPATVRPDSLTPSLKHSLFALCGSLQRRQ